jgi:hypothetical protein
MSVHVFPFGYHGYQFISDLLGYPGDDVLDDETEKWTLYRKWNIEGFTVAYLVPSPKVGKEENRPIIHITIDSDTKPDETEAVKALIGHCVLEGFDLMYNNNISGIELIQYFKPLTIGGQTSHAAPRVYYKQFTIGGRFIANLRLRYLSWKFGLPYVIQLDSNQFEMSR